jgi:hypothetical protein
MQFVEFKSLYVRSSIPLFVSKNGGRKHRGLTFAEAAARYRQSDALAWKFSGDAAINDFR